MNGLRQSRVVVITLGLVELWWDGHAETYLNEAPSFNMVRLHKDRFSFEVLDYDQVLSCANSIMTLLRDFKGPCLRVMVSPVPLQEPSRATTS